MQQGNWLILHQSECRILRARVVDGRLHLQELRTSGPAADLWLTMGEMEALRCVTEPQPVEELLGA